MPMEIIFSDEFRKEFQKIKEREVRVRIIKQLQKIAQEPQSGKPLRYDWRNHRSVRVTPFRIIYRLEKDRLIVNCFDHRKDVYD